jgi:hypothetical protein
MKPLYSEKERYRNGSFRVTWGKDSADVSGIAFIAQ